MKHLYLVLPLAFAWLTACASSGNPPAAIDEPADNDPGELVVDPGEPPVSDEPVPEFPANCGDQCYRDEGVDPSVLPAFQGTSTPGLLVAYPPSGAVHPVNFGRIAFHFKKEAAETAFELRVDSSGTTYRLYLPCEDPGVFAESNECVLRPPPLAWLSMANQLSGGTAKAQVSALEVGGNVRSSGPIDIEFSGGPLEGVVYYWNTSLKGIYRALSGSAEAVPFVRPNSSENEARCGGCHSVSRDGTVISFVAGLAESGSLRVVSTEDLETDLVEPGNTHDVTMPALSPDGRYVAVALSGALSVLEVATGQALAAISAGQFPAGKSAFHPEWSPGGDAIAITLSSEFIDDWTVTSGDIAVVPFKDEKLGIAQVVVADTEDEFHFYPSWSPDGKWLAFASAPKGSPGGSTNQRLAGLRLVSSEGGKVYFLERALAGTEQTSTWPKFAPFSGENRFYLTYNSKADYGFSLPNSRLSESERSPQLWMTALDMSFSAGDDPSTPSIWLPMQDVSQSNHLAFWAEKIPCATNGCDSGQACINGACVAVVK